MTSMIDVVFLLLIFFLVTTTFIKPERHLTGNILVERPESGIQPNDLEPAVIDIFRRGDAVIYQLGGTQTSQLVDLRSALHDFDNKQHGGFVRVGPDVPFENAASAIGILKSSGFPVVSYLSATTHE